LFERVTGKTFDRTAPEVPVRDRIRAALTTAFPEYF